MKAKKPIDYLSTIDKSIFIKSLTNLHFSHIILRSTILHTRISLSKLNQIHLSVSVYFLVYQELSQRSLLWAVRSKRSSSPASFLVVEGRGISVSTRQSSRVSGGGGVTVARVSYRQMGNEELAGGTATNKGRRYSLVNRKK